MPRHYALTPANVHDTSLLTIWSRTVHFPHYKQMDEKTTRNGKNSLWKCPKLYAPSGEEGCNLFQRNANAPVFASLVSGTTRWPIVHYLPDVRSLFPIDVWRDVLRSHPDCDFGNELLQDINFGVPIGFNHNFTP